MRHLELIPTVASVETAEYSRSVQLAIAVKRDDEPKESQITVMVGATFSSVNGLTRKEWPIYAQAVELAFEEYAARFGEERR